MGKNLFTYAAEITLHILLAILPQLPQKINQPQQIFQSEMRTASRHDHIRVRLDKISEVQRNLA
jgi:hypothetical protein